MAAANPQLLRTLSELWRNRADATVVVDSGRVQRSLHIESGDLVAADSDVLTERLGVQLVADGKLDAALVGPLVTAARVHGRPFGQQVVAENLLSAQDLKVALEHQFSTRFDRALQMTGEVAVQVRNAPQRIVRRSIPAAVMRSFRRVSIDVASAMVSLLPPHHDRMHEDLLTAEQLELEPNEVRYFRQLASGMDATGVLDRAQDYECALRVCAALVAMGAIPTEKADPITELLMRRSA